MDTQRLILFFVFSFSLLLLWDAWQKEQRPAASLPAPAAKTESGVPSPAKPIGPATPYGVSKLAQEMLAGHDEVTRVFVARPFNHAGPRQSPTFATSGFARQIAEIEAGRRDPVLQVGNLDARRDITDVRDTVRAYRLIVTRGTARRPYNVCSGKAYRVGDLLDALVALSPRAIAVEVDSSRFRPSDNPLLLGDGSRIAAETGWSPEIPIERTLQDLLDYWRREVSRAAPGA